LGITLDSQKNLAGPTGTITEIQAEGSPVKVLIIPTNEELEIAIQAVDVISK
jgi:acetate kinase